MFVLLTVVLPFSPNLANCNDKFENVLTMEEEKCPDHIGQNAPGIDNRKVELVKHQAFC